MRLLTAAADTRTRTALCHLFEAHNYLTDTVASGDEALAYAETGEYDGLILDSTLPGCDSLGVLTRLRANGVSTPTLFLTAAGDVQARVDGLEAGADDCLPKPYATAELLARVRAMLRRKDTYTPEVLCACGLTLDRATFTLQRGTVQRALSAKEYQVMEYLMAHPEQIIQADKLLTHIWGWESEVSMSVLWVHISNIRKKLRALGVPARIRFVRGAGYIFDSSLP